MSLPRILAGKRRHRYLLLVANGLLQAAATVAVALLVQRSFDHLLVQGGASAGAFWPTAAALAGALLANAALRWRALMDAERLGQSYAHAVRMTLFRHVTRIGAAGTQHLSKGALMLRFIGDLAALQRWVSHGLAQLTVGGLAALIALAALAVLEPIIAITAGLVVLLAGALAFLIGPGMTRATKDVRRRRGRLAGRLGDRLGALGVMEAFGQERRERRNFGKLSRALRDALVRRARLVGLLRAGAEAAAGLASLLALLAGAGLVTAGAASPGAVVAAITVAGLLAPRIQELGRVYEYWNAAAVARAKQEQLLALKAGARPRKLKHGGVIGAGRTPLVELRGAGHGKALKPLDLLLRPGERLGIVGPNGAGKTTLLFLLGGFLRPDKGQVLLDGKDMKQLPWARLRQVFAIVSPDLPLLRGSLRHNLTYGGGRPDDGELRATLASCALEDLVSRLPEGLDSKIVEGGEGLSSGERARIALARALLAKPAILLLDEAEAHLDADARSCFQHAIADFPGSVVFITHDQAQARGAGRLLCLSQGRLLAEGPPDEVLAEGSAAAAHFRNPLKLVKG